jgi:hypothetical protein
MPRHSGSSEARRQAVRRRLAAAKNDAMRPRGRGKRRRSGWHEPPTLAETYERTKP